MKINNFLRLVLGICLIITGTSAYAADYTAYYTAENPAGYTADANAASHPATIGGAINSYTADYTAENPAGYTASANAASHPAIIGGAINSYTADYTAENPAGYTADASRHAAIVDETWSHKSCEPYIQQYQSESCDQSCKIHIRKEQPDCFYGVETVSSTSFAQIIAISNVVSSRFFSKGSKTAAKAKGMSSGSANPNWNAWGSLTHNDTDQNDKVNNFNSKILTTVVGGDYSLSPDMVLGVSFSFDNGDGSINGANMESSGYSVAPYFGFQLNQNFTLDVSLGFGTGEVETAGNTKDDSDRLFGAANLSYNSWSDNIQLTSRLSYLHGRESYDATKINGVSIAGTDEENRISQMRASFQAGYWMANMMPYAGLAYVTDISRSTLRSNGSGTNIGPNGWLLTLGMDFFSLSNGITGGIAYSREEGRTNQDNDMVVANISVRF